MKIIYHHKTEENQNRLHKKITLLMHPQSGVCLHQMKLKGCLTQYMVKYKQVIFKFVLSSSNKVKLKCAQSNGTCERVTSLATGLTYFFSVDVTFTVCIFPSLLGMMPTGHRPLGCCRSVISTTFPSFRSWVSLHHLFRVSLVGNFWWSGTRHIQHLTVHPPSVSVSS